MTAPDKRLSDTIHATAIALLLQEGAFAFSAATPRTVLLRGPSGSGKSDLAFRLIASGMAQLLADDRVVLDVQDGQLMAAAPPALAGLIEVRGLGLLRLPPAPAGPVGLVVDLVARADVPRLPDTHVTELCNIAVPCLRLHAFDVSAPDKIIAALAVVARPEIIVK